MSDALQPVPKPESGKSRRRASVWKHVEREGGRWLQKHDGPDPKVQGSNWVSSLGRVANTTQAGYDLRSKHYCGECKSRESFPKWLMDCWRQIVNIAQHEGKAALLILKEPHVKPLHIITEERHAELLGYEREAEQLRAEAEKRGA